LKSELTKDEKKVLAAEEYDEQGQEHLKTKIKRIFKVNSSK
jgi:hypothetical protein